MSIANRRAPLARAGLPHSGAQPMPPFPERRLRAAALAFAALALPGCASFSGDGGLASVASLTRQHTGYDFALAKGAADPAAVDALLAQPLDADTAVRLALLNSRALQAALAELGGAEADYVQAGRMRNPSFSFSKLHGGENEIERGVMFDLAGLLTLPARQRIERGRFEQAKLQAAAQAVQLAADTRRAYFNAVGRRPDRAVHGTRRHRRRSRRRTGARMVQAGNSSKLDQAREQAVPRRGNGRSSRARAPAPRWPASS